MENRGYKVVLASDGEEALEVLGQRRSEIDLVISDLVMPRLGGLQLRDALRQGKQSVKLILASGYAARDVRESVAVPGDVPFLHKPWTLADLLVTVRQVLDQP